MQTTKKTTFDPKKIYQSMQKSNQNNQFVKKVKKMHYAVQPPEYVIYGKKAIM